MDFALSGLRGGRLHYLLDLTWGGVTYRLARERVTAPLGEAGADVDYHPGLETDGVAQEVKPFSDNLEERSVSLTLHLGDLVDVPARIAAGHPLSAATGVLRLWLEGSSQVVTLIDGEVRTPDYGHRDDPVTLTLEEAPWIAPTLIPAASARINSTTWPNHDDERTGDRYPIVLGEPGGASQGSPHGGPAYYVDTSFLGDKLLIAGHRVAASQVRIVNLTAKNTEVFSVTHQADGLGRVCAVVDVSSPSTLTVDEGDDFAVLWGTGSGGGMPRRGDSTQAERRAGGILEWLLSVSGIRYDAGRLAAARSVLDRYLIDATISAPPDKRISPWDWIREQLTPLLPISWSTGPDGIYPVVWRYDAAAADARRAINADSGEAERLDAIEYADADPAQEVSVSYNLDFTKGRPRRLVGLSGDAGTYDADPDYAPDRILQRSWVLHARQQQVRKRSVEVKAEAVKHRPTAWLIAGWRARRHALAPRVMRYRGPLEWATLEPGDVVTVTDSEVSLAGLLALVEAVEVDETGWVSLRLVEAYPA